MANTYTLISSNVLSSSAASVTFSAIPSTYTDLVLRMSIRGTHTGFTVNGQLYVNNETTANFSNTQVDAYGSTPESSRNTGLTYQIVSESVPGTSYTSNTFSSSEVYLPNYAGSANKVFSVFTATENNSATVNYLVAQAGLRSATAALNELKFQAASGNLAAGSSFYLYGIKNS